MIFGAKVAKKLHIAFNPPIFLVISTLTYLQLHDGALCDSTGRVLTNDDERTMRATENCQLNTAYVAALTRRDRNKGAQDWNGSVTASAGEKRIRCTTAPKIGSIA